MMMPGAAPFVPGQQVPYQPPPARYYSIDVECVATGTGERARRAGGRARIAAPPPPPPAAAACAAASRCPPLPPPSPQPRQSRAPALSASPPARCGRPRGAGRPGFPATDRRLVPLTALSPMAPDAACRVVWPLPEVCCGAQALGGALGRDWAPIRCARSVAAAAIWRRREQQSRYMAERALPAPERQKRLLRLPPGTPQIALGSAPAWLTRRPADPRIPVLAGAREPAGPPHPTLAPPPRAPAAPAAPRQPAWLAQESPAPAPALLQLTPAPPPPRLPTQPTPSTPRPAPTQPSSPATLLPTHAATRAPRRSRQRCRRGTAAGRPRLHARPRWPRKPGAAPRLPSLPQRWPSSGTRAATWRAGRWQLSGRRARRARQRRRSGERKPRCSRARTAVSEAPQAPQARWFARPGRCWLVD